MDPVFLSLDEVLEIHEQQIERYGGSAGLRDAAGLESAVAQAQASFGAEFLHSSIPAMAAAYLFHLCQNHAFVDGNKRVGANAALTFLLLNDWEPLFSEEELVDLVMSVASGRLAKARLIEAFEGSCKPQTKNAALVARILSLIVDPHLRTDGAMSTELYPPVTLELVESAEAALGFPLPPLLRELYVQVGDGGFGPGHGIIGLEDGFRESLSEATLPDLYHYYLETDDVKPWREKLVPLFDMGCSLIHSIDCSAEGYPVVAMGEQRRLEPTGIRFDDYMEQWVKRMEARRGSRAIASA